MESLELDANTMIALRGHLKQQEDKKWKWQGVWAFGDLPEITSKSAKNPSTRPFNYTWIESESATNVLVPSLIVHDDHENDDNDDDDIDEDISLSLSTDIVIDSAGTNEITVTTTGPTADMTDPVITESVVKNVNTYQGNAYANDVDNDNTSTKIVTIEEKEEPTTLKAPEPTQIEYVIEKKEAETLIPNILDERKGDGSVDSTGESKFLETINNIQSGTTATTPANESDLQRMPPPQPKISPRGITFATTSVEEPNYTEGHTLYPGKISPDGNWTGYFENASKRKDRNSSRVSEHFSIFFNATPAKDARMLFLDDEEDVKEDVLDLHGSDYDNSSDFATKYDDARGINAVEKVEEGHKAPIHSETTFKAKSKKSIRPGLLPPGFVHVRGMGTNQFGTFELLGALDLATNILECQRMYVVTPDNTKAATSRKKSVSTRQKTPDGVQRPYSTRKRQLTWQRRSSMSDDEDEMIGMKRFSSIKKRPRPMSDAKSQIALVSPRPAEPSNSSVPVSAKRPPLVVPSADVANGPKKRTPAASKVSVPVGGIKVPPVGDPNQARWRAAHFFYYQRHDSTTEENNGANNGAAASFVVYEGEMLNGGCQRDGRGVCLFNNGTLYEGEWKRNKEHGKGTLMTADRRRIMYEGEWERGRMHGQGSYFYPDDTFAQTLRNTQVDSRYIGEFKENARHGIGKYFLPDGSTYEGEWRDNDMSGQGTFCWPDGSMYIGLWKGGKRHGMGALTSSDGFTYDGMWIQNAMEGRGIAGYPSGQRYEGLWSNGRREGRGTIVFTNGAVYEGRFRDDCMEGQGTMKMSQNVTVPTSASSHDNEAGTDDWMIPISFQSDIGHIHQKAGFTVGGE